MGDMRVAGVTGLVFGLAAVPVLHFVAVDLESKAGADVFLAGVEEHWVRIALAGGFGLILACVLLVHLVALRRVAAGRRALLADAATAVAALAALGVALSSAAALLGAYGAHESYPFEAVRPMGILAESLVAVLSPTLAGSAWLVSVLGIKDGLVPRWLGVTGAVFGVVLTATGVLLPGAGLLPATVWVLVVGIGLVVAGRQEAPAAVTRVGG